MRGAAAVVDVRARDADRSREQILRAAMAEFAGHGLGGGRIDAIAERARVNKKLIYYYFGGKDELFLAVLEQTYADIRAAERALHLEASDPVLAIRKLISFTWEHYLAHPEFLALLNSENMQRGEHLKRSQRVRELNSPLIALLAALLERGSRTGVFRSGVDALQLYVSIAGLAYFYLSNNHTLSAIFGRGLMTPTALDERLEHITDVVLGYLSSRPGKQGNLMDAIDLGYYRHHGHVTVNAVFTPAEMDALTRDIEAWGESFLAELPPEQRAWYIDGGVQTKTVLRKLDNPHAHRPAVQRLAKDPRLIGLVEQFLGRGVSVYFSQIFFKPPEGGGPKPAHQDNFYFGPTDDEGVVTAWIALDDATLENGCLYFGDGTNQGPVYSHFAPVGEPHNLQLPGAVLDKQPMAPAPVRKGGVSFHHGNTFHQSGPNHSSRWRRACALHFVRNDVEFATPALPYDHSLKFQVSGSGATQVSGTT